MWLFIKEIVDDGDFWFYKKNCGICHIPDDSNLIYYDIHKCLFLAFGFLFRNEIS